MALMNLYLLKQIRIILYLWEAALEHNLAFFENYDSINQVKEIDCVGYQDYGFAFEMLQQNIFENLFLHVGIESWDGIVQKYQVSISVDCSSKRDSCLLAPAQVDAFLADFSFISVR